MKGKKLKKGQQHDIVLENFEDDSSDVFPHCIEDKNEEIKETPRLPGLRLQLNYE